MKNIILSLVIGLFASSICMAQINDDVLNQPQPHGLNPGIHPGSPVAINEIGYRVPGIEADIFEDARITSLNIIAPTSSHRLRLKAFIENHVEIRDAEGNLLMRQWSWVEFARTSWVPVMANDSINAGPIQVGGDETVQGIPDLKNTGVVLDEESGTYEVRWVIEVARGSDLNEVIWRGVIAQCTYWSDITDYYPDVTGGLGTGG